MTLQSPAWRKKFIELSKFERDKKISAVTEELTKLIQPENLSAMFDEFIVDTQNSPHHTDSYRHDNGFDKIVLYQDSESKMKLRLHIWHPLVSPTKRARQNVHNHRWDFSSAVLLGYADNVMYRFAEKDEGGEDFFHYRYYARESKEHYEIEKLGKTKLIESELQRVEAGDIYSVKNEILHRVDTPDYNLVATLVVTHENTGWITNDLLTEKELLTEGADLPSPAMNKGEIIEKIIGLRAILNV